MVLIGSGSDPEVARYGARWRLAEWADKWAEAVGTEADSEWIAGARDAIVDVLKSAGVVGNMPNIPANRLNSQFDVAGHPVISVPCGMADGLPFGMMMVGKHFDDKTVIRVADAFENIGDWRKM